MASHPDNNQERSVGSLLNDLAEQSSQLVRKEIELAKAEMSEKLSEAKTGLMLLLFGAVGLIVGLFYLLDALMFGLGEVLPADYSPWLAALIVGAVAAGAGYAAIQKGRQQLSTDHLKPQRTVRSLNDDARMVKEQTR